MDIGAATEAELYRYAAELKLELDMNGYYSQAGYLLREKLTAVEEEMKWRLSSNGQPTLTVEEHLELAKQLLWYIPAQTGDWFHYQAYMRLCQTGKIELERNVGGRVTNHEKDLPLIRKMETMKMLRVEVGSKICLHPTAGSAAIFEMMQDRPQGHRFSEDGTRQAYVDHYAGAGEF